MEQKKYLFYHFFKLGDIEMCKHLYDKSYKIRLYEMWYTVDHYKFMVSVGIDVTVANNLAVTRACGTGKLEVVKYLVSEGVDVTGDGNWAIRHASQCGHLEVVKYLVSLGVDITTANNYPIRLARQYGHQHVVDYIESIS